jgi:hypothetical protein
MALLTITFVKPPAQDQALPAPQMIVEDTESLTLSDSTSKLASLVAPGDQLCVFDTCLSVDTVV